MDRDKLYSLLRNVSLIVEKYDSKHTSGENFNIFNVLKLTSNEVRTHSAFLAELLNPRGSHGKQSLFLELFVEQFHINDFDCFTAKVEIEKHIGFITESKTDGGYIDILIADNHKRAIIIENKIFASDQECQLRRYYNYGQNNHLETKIFYLTLDGRSASERSKSGIDESHYIKISYAQDILAWLELCSSECANQPVLQAVLLQYCSLIKQLTNQSTSTKMKEDIISEIISSESNIKTLFELQKNDIITSIKRTVIDKFASQLQGVANDLELEFKVEGAFDNHGGFFMFPLKSSAKGFCIEFGFCFNYNNMFYAVHCADEHVESLKDQLLARLGKRDKGFDSCIWVNWMEDDIRYWDNSSEPWLMVIDGQMKENIKAKIIYILNCLKGLEL